MFVGIFVYKLFIIIIIYRKYIFFLTKQNIIYKQFEIIWKYLNTECNNYKSIKTKIEKQTFFFSHNQSINDFWWSW